MLRFLPRFCPLFVALLVGIAAPIHAQNSALTQIDSPQPLKYVMALLRDRSGALWVGTEGNGVWRYDPALADQKAKAWTQFGAKNGLGDEFVYALAQDWQGRIWAAHATAGVSVWNGREWANYGIVEDEDRAPKGRQGPLGERVFGIAVSPVNGDVFLATSLGVTIYNSKTDSWSYRTRREGLPSNQISCLAFDSTGDLYVGTQSEGVTRGAFGSGYTQWQTTLGADILPNVGEGKGLPGRAINDITVSDDDVLYVATKNGLARSSDFGENWSFLRGYNWEKRAQGRFQAVAIEPPADVEARPRWTREDYATNVAEDADGLLYLGFRARGWEARRPLTDWVPYVSTPNDKPDLAYISAIWPQTGAGPILGFYGEGLKIGEKVPEVGLSAVEREKRTQRRGWKTANLPPLSATVPKLPSSAKAPTLGEIDELLKPLSALKTPFQAGSALYEGDDWRTKGDWVGRYGREYTVLCAARAPLNHYVTLDSASYQADGFIGPHFQGEDSLRHWVHWVKTDNPNTLYDPVIGYRRQAEWDDHGETYPFEFEGPDVWAKVQVPNGVHRLSLYFFNKDGLQGFNRARDYALEIRAGAGYEDVKSAQNAPVVARARVRDFWNGVYKRFIVRGPAPYWVKVGRDGSFNTILSAVMLDKLSGPRTWADAMPLAYMGRFKYEAPDWSEMGKIESLQPIIQRARIWEWKLNAALTREGGLAQTDGVSVLALRALNAQPKTQIPPQLLTRWRWKSAIWNKKDRNSWNTAMPEAREAFFDVNPQARDLEW